MASQSAPRPEFKAGQVAVLEMGASGDSYLAFASAPEESNYSAG